jgi:hypothetical protein
MLTYETFMNHAAKVTETVSKNNPELKGVYHHPDGSLVVTDGKRLYKVFGIEHGKELGSIYTPKGKKIDKPYPDTNRFVQIANDDSRIYHFETNELLQAVDLVSCIPVALKETPILYFEENRLKCQYKSGERAFYYLPVLFPERFVLNGQFLLEALKLIKAAKCKEFSLVYKARLRPIFLTTDNITILILPMRVY